MPRAPLPGAGRRATLAVLVAALALAGCDAHPAAAGIPVSRNGCGVGWRPAHGGPQTISLYNPGTVTVEIDLIDPGTGGVYAEVEALGAGTTRAMRVTLGPGRYALRCLPEDSDALTGPTVRLTDGPRTGAPAVLPVTEQDLTGAVRAYRAYVSAGLVTLASDVDRLRATLRSGPRAAAQAAWLTAHLGYERLGAAYDTFGDLGDAIDGGPDGRPDGVRAPDFTGFRRLEYGLWHGEPLSTLSTVAGRLAADVASLRRGFPTAQTDPNDLPLRAHEIMENALQFELTGQADQGSRTGLATVAANLAGTGAVLAALAPVLRERYRGWSTVEAELTRTGQLVDAGRRPDGRWTAPTALGRADRERLDAAVGRLLEDLAPIAAIGDVRRTS